MFKHALIIAFFLGLVAGPANAAATPPPKASSPLGDALARMGHHDNWGHPDLQGEVDGIRHYAHHDYHAAMQAFLHGARYADKLSQLCIGLMYLNGQGVAKNPATAWAWLSIAAQRHYPGYSDTRDRVWNTLQPAQRTQALATRKKLLPIYGDAQAKKRMRAELNHDRSELATGSLAGIGSGATCTTPPGHTSNCDGIYQQWRWNPSQYFATRDAIARGTVTVGKVSQSPQPKH